MDGRYQAFLARRYGGVTGVNRAYPTPSSASPSPSPPFEEPIEPTWREPDDLRYRDWREFKAALSPGLYVRVSGDAAWRAHLRRKYDDLPGLNRAWNTSWASWAEVMLPEMGRLKVGTLKVGTLKVERSESEPSTFNFQPSTFNPKPERDWREFALRGWPARFQERAGGRVRLVSAENLFRRFLRQKVRHHREGEPAFGTGFGAFASVPAPYALNDWMETREHAPALRRRFALKNYATVIDRFAVEGRSLWNTLFFCAASILVALTVNPLCAYALSRFQLPVRLQDPAVPAGHHRVPG